MARTDSQSDVLVVYGMRFLYDEENDEVWLWEEKGQVWSVLPDKPSYLKVVNGKLVLIDIKTGRHKCICDPFVVNNFGCKCGGD